MTLPTDQGPELIALIHGVPARTTRTGVIEALAVGPRWGAWQARVGPAGRLNVTRKVDGFNRIEAHNGAKRISWESLTPGERVLTARTPGADYAAYSRAARAAGLSLADWVRTACTEKLERSQ